MTEMMEILTDLPEKKKEQKPNLQCTDYRPSLGTNAHSEGGFQETSYHAPSAEFQPPRLGPSIFHI